MTYWYVVSLNKTHVSAAVPSRLPQPCSVRHLVECFLDIAAVPRRSFFELLATFASNELEREKLAEFSSSQGQDELYAYCNRPRRTTLEVRAKSSVQRVVVVSEHLGDEVFLCFPRYLQTFPIQPLS